MEKFTGFFKKKKDKSLDDTSAKENGRPNDEKLRMGSFVVASIDFGTTFSGTAFAFKQDIERDPMKIHANVQSGGKLVSLKAPTCVLIKRDGLTLDCFGYEAEHKYDRLTAQGEHENWLYFRHFKMMLHKEENFKKDTQLEDFTGKRLSAMTVFALSITYLKDELLRTINDRMSGIIKQEEIRWVITVPAIWNDSAKRFMRSAAEQAGIDGNRLNIALEPEAASLYCRLLPVERGAVGDEDTLATLRPESVYLILDAGGGTVDITVHKTTTSGKIREVHHATGGDWGGTNIDEAFIETLTDIFGMETMNQFKTNDTEDYHETLMDFEKKKREICPSMTFPVTFRIPLALIERYQEITGTDLEKAISSSPYKDKVSHTFDKVRINPDVMKGLFSRSISSITDHVKSLLKEETVRDCNTILLVGGYSESEMLQEAIKESFPTKRVIIPKEAGLTVLKGAVLYGFTPEAITERICKYTYGTSVSHVTDASCSHPPCPTFYDDEGIKHCDNIFGVHVEKGQAVKLGERQEEQYYSTFCDDANTILFDVLTSTERNPSLVTDPGCREIGRFTVPITEGLKGNIGVSFLFGGTELEVIAWDERSRKVTKHHIELVD